MVGVQMREKKVGPRHVDVELGELTCEALVALRAAETGVDQQIPVPALDDVAVEQFQRAVGQRDGQTVKVGHQFLWHLVFLRYLFCRAQAAVLLTKRASIAATSLRLAVESGASVLVVWPVM